METLDASTELALVRLKGIFPARSARSPIPTAHPSQPPIDTPLNGSSVNSPRDMALLITTARRADGALFSAARSVDDPKLPTSACLIASGNCA